MYNKQIKNQYLAYAQHQLSTDPTMINMLIGLFHYTEETERQLSKDLYEFDTADIKILFENLKSKSKDVMEKTCIFLENYYDWYWIKVVHADISGTINPFNKEDVKFIIQRTYLKSL